MKRRIRKYILFSIMLGMTIACLTSTTYAFVLINNSVEIQAFDLQIDTGRGMLISYDGVRYYNAISSSQLETYIKSLHAGDQGEKFTSFASMNLAPVTMKQELDTTYKISYNEVADGNTNLPKSQFINMQKDSVVYDNTLGYDSVFASHHEMVDAKKNVDYLTFDLYFKLDGSYDLEHKTYSVELSGNDNRTNSFIRNTNPTIPATLLQNDLTVYDDQGAPVVYGPTQKTNEYDRRSIQVDAKNAMRMAFVNTVTTNQVSSNNIVIVEDEIGWGSAAVEGRDDSTKSNYDANDYAHHKSLNAMYTYYNNLWKPAFTTAAQDGEAFDAQKYVTLGTNTKLGTFSDTDDDFNVVKVTVTIWLEGWDADYFLNIEHGISKFQIRLKFDLAEANKA